MSNRHGARRGFTLIEVIVAMFLLALAALMYTALFSVAEGGRFRSETRARALALAQKQIEAIRGEGYGSANYDRLRATGLIDAEPTASPFSFTNSDAAAGDRPSALLPDGTGAVAIVNETATRRRVTVTVSYSDRDGTLRAVELTTLLSEL